MKILTKKKENKLKNTIFLILVIIWMIMVFCFSNQPGINSENTSSRVTSIFVKAMVSLKLINIEQIQETISTLDPFIRKLAHYLIYTIGGFLIANYINVYNVKKVEKKVYSSICIGAIYATTDEIHQYFIDGRSAQITDVMLDTLGIITGVCFFLCVLKIIKK